MTTITVLWILMTGTEKQISSALRCWTVGALLSMQCFKQQIGDLLWRDKFSWQAVLELELLSLVPFGIVYLVMLAAGAMRGSTRPMTNEELEAQARADAEYRAQLQEYANIRAIDYFNSRLRD